MLLKDFSARLISITKLSRRCVSYSPKLPTCNFVPNKYEGPTFNHVKEIRKKFMPPSIYTIYKRPLLLHQGHMQWVFDNENERYLDLIGGICTISAGHCHPKITKIVNEQINTLWHTSNIYHHPTVHQYSEKLASKFPGDLKIVYFVNSGTEANDLALMLARLYTGNYDTIALQNSYHGLSTSMMGLTGSVAYKHPTSSGNGVHHAMLPDPFRGIWGGSNCRDSISQVDRKCSCSPDECEASDKYFEQLEEIFKYSVPKGRIAAMFAEPIQGVGGTVQYPKGYLKRAQKLIHNNGGVFIADEVQTGFGRTGDHFWGFESHGIIPDIVTLAKGIGNGFPLGAVVTTPEIAAAHTKALYFNTFGGNAVACSVGKAVLEVIEEEGLQNNCKVVGAHFMRKLLNLKDKRKEIGDVRGKGLMIGVELVEPGTTEPLAMSKILYIMELSKDMGVLWGRGGSNGNVIRIKPPMCVTKEDADFAIDILEKALEFCAVPDDLNIVK